MNVRMKLSFEAALVEARGRPTKEAALTHLARWAEEEFRDKRKVVTDAVRDKVIAMFEEGATVREIARAVELSEPTVRKVYRDRFEKQGL